MRFYVASRLANLEAVRELIKGLTDLGHNVTHDWTRYGLKRRESDPEHRARIADYQMKGVVVAGFVVVLTPCGFNTHVELGAALACGIPVILVGTQEDRRAGRDYDCVFHFHPFVMRVDTVAEVPAAVLEWAGL